jgi:hypothetical protein
MIKVLCTFFVVLIALGSACAQIEHSGKIMSKDSIDFLGVTVSLFSKDSTLISSNMAHQDGTFVVLSKNQDSCFLRFDSEEIQPFTTQVISCLELDFGTFELVRIKLVDEVVVKAKKPFIERKPGMVIVNAQESVLATGLSSFEFIEKLPGVRVDANENITLNGKSGIIVQINGKNLPQSGQELANYLRGIPMSMIDKIELINTPSAKYDAAGVAIINIVMKKDARLGTNGTANLGGGHGFYPKFNSGLSLNHRNRKINVYGSYNYARRVGMNDLKLDRYFYHQNQLTGGYLQNNYFVMKVNSHNVKTGLDWQMNAKNSLSIGIHGIHSGYGLSGHNHADVLDSTRNLVSTFETYTKNNDAWGSAGTNLSYVHVLDTFKSEWSVDVDYSKYAHRSNQQIDSYYYLLSGQSAQNPYLLSGTMNGKLDVFAAKTDLRKNFKRKNSLEFGMKSSYVIADNDLKFNNVSSGQPVYDTTKSNHYVYRENINAVYAMYFHSFKKWSIQLGLRGELSNIHGLQKVFNQRKDTMYFQLFPSLGVKFGTDENHQWDLTVSRRIDRPSYDQLNPFKFYLDPTTYKDGNPNLGPQLTYAIDASFMLNQRHLFTVGLAHTEHNITEIIGPVKNQPQITAQTMVNLATVDLMYVGVNLSYDVAAWWTTLLNFNTYYALYSGSAAQTTIQNQGNVVVDFSTVNTFLLPKSWIVELSGNFHSSEKYAFDHIRSLGALNLGVQKKICKNKGVLKLSFNDVFFTSPIKASVRFTDYDEDFIVKRDSRVVMLSFTYKFGKNSAQNSRRRGTASDDLKGRINVGG